MKISSVLSAHNINVFTFKRADNVNKDKKIQNNQSNQIYLSSNSLGRDLVTFGAKVQTKVQTNVNDKWFKLPEGCTPDDFQIQSGKALSEGKNVLVEAPTGTGKTAIAHYATGKNLSEGKKTFYTTPLKALSNQKLNEFRKIYGEENVGILTGDRRENADAPIIIMTTEVYRNMALSETYGEPVDLMKNVGTVIFDEFHYLGDESRGSGWEESILLTPKDVQILGLSATIGNPKKMQKWLSSLTNEGMELVSIPSEARHVPLKYEQIKTGAYYSAIKKGKKTKTDEVENERRINVKPTIGDYNNVVKKLDSRDQLPAIFFVFSKKFSKEMVEYFANMGDDLTTKEEKKQIETILDKYKENGYIGSNLNVAALKKGYAVHNAGIMPEQKALIEELFQKKLLKVVVATETLAAGINMPAKTVLISNPYKPSGSINRDLAMRILTSNEFHQMAGRAGRRGIDDVGYVYSLTTNSETESIFTELEDAPSEDLISNFNPEYPFLAGYYDYNDDDKNLQELFNKSLFVFDEQNGISEENKNKLIEASKQKTNVLLDRGFLTKKNSKIELTPKGEMVSVIRGYDPLTLVETIYDKTYNYLTPEAFAMVIASIANPAEGKDADLLPENITSILEETEDSLFKTFNSQKRSIEGKLANLGKQMSDFSSNEELLKYLEGIEVPSVNSIEIKNRLNELIQLKRKLSVIQSGGGKYSVFDIVKSFERGTQVPTTVLKEYLEIINEYKTRNNVKDISRVVSRIENELKSLDFPSKGAKAQNKLNKRKQDCEERLKYAKAMKYLDERIFDEIGNNYSFVKRHSASEIDREYNELRTLYIKFTSTDSIKESVKSCMEIEKFLSLHDPTIEAYYLEQDVADCIDDVYKKSYSIYQTEASEKIDKEPIRLGSEVAKLVYKWSYLNSVHSDSMANWKQLVNSGGEHSLDEGTMYRAILQTHDLLSQISEVLQIGMKNAKNPEDIEYYTDLMQKTNVAKKLLIKEPVVIS